MKLGMRGELTQTERDAAHKPSDLYHALAKHYKEPITLTRFIYAIEKLGHGRHGRRAVSKLSEFSVSKPEKFNPATYMTEDKLKLFHLYQCLVDVLVHLEEEYYPKLITHFAKTCLQGINPSTIDSPCALFIQMLEREVITIDDTGILAEGLRKVGDYKNANKVYQYYQSHGMYHYACTYLKLVNDSTPSDDEQQSINIPSEISSLTEPESLYNDQGNVILIYCM